MKIVGNKWKLRDNVVWENLKDFKILLNIYISKFNAGLCSNSQIVINLQTDAQKISVSVVR
jgi:hypothetical protein